MLFSRAGHPTDSASPSGDSRAREVSAICGRSPRQVLIPLKSLMMPQPIGTRYGRPMANTFSLPVTAAARWKFGACRSIKAQAEAKGLPYKLREAEKAFAAILL